MTAAGSGLAWAGDEKVARPRTAGAPVSQAAPRPAATLSPAAQAFLTPLWALSPPTSPGMVLALDPVTGDRVLPTPHQLQEIQLGFAERWDSTGESVVIGLPNGSRGAYVGRRFAKALMAHRSLAGRIVWGCGPQPAQAPPQIAVEE